jgi:6-phosphogluconolactonase/glucosamine-6-phosphate isomerase/deaminase
MAIVMTTLHTRRFVSRSDLDRALAERLGRAVAYRNKAGTAIMLAGGKTPLPAYRELAARGPIHNEHLQILFSDERYVPASSNESNYHQSCELLNELALPEDSLLRVRTELPLEQAAADYERRLAVLVASGTRVKLGLLELGPDGHTAALFQETDLERARGHMAIAVERPDGLFGITVTPEFLTHVEELVFVVAGGGKRDAIRALMNADPSLPARRAVEGLTNVELWVEQAAMFSLMADGGLSASERQRAGTDT